MPYLVEVWNAVQQAYVDHRINSERCLQAIMYQHLLGHVDEDERVLVEPSVDVPGQRTPLKPDLVLRNDTEVKAFVEIKCAPHVRLRHEQLDPDLEKLLQYSNLGGQHVKLDIFGPNYVWNKQQQLWNPRMPQFEVSPEALVIFAVIGLGDDPACYKTKLVGRKEALGQLGDRFKVLSLRVNPGSQPPCVACVE